MERWNDGTVEWIFFSHPFVCLFVYKLLFYVSLPAFISGNLVFNQIV